MERTREGKASSNISTLAVMILRGGEMESSAAKRPGRTGDGVTAAAGTANGEAAAAALRTTPYGSPQHLPFPIAHAYESSARLLPDVGML